MDFHGIAALRARPACRVIDQVLGPTQLELHLERRENALVCPRCQTCCSGVKESRLRGLRALPILERPTVLWLHVRRFECRACQHRPWEQRETFGTRTPWTERLSNQVRQALLRGCPGQARARRDGLSARSVFRWTCARSRGGRPRKLGRVIGIDAYARRQGQRSNTLMVDGDQGQPLVTLQGRRADEVVAWFSSRPQEERARVEVVVVDRSKPYAAALQEGCGDQVHGIDRFHVVQQAVDARDSVLRSVKNQRHQDEAQELKKLRKRWRKSADHLDVDARIARDDWRRRCPE